MSIKYHVLVILVDDIYKTCTACPTIFEFNDFIGDHYYFRLRYGSWRLVNETTEEEIASGTTNNELDGCCSEDEMIEMLSKEGIYLVL